MKPDYSELVKSITLFKSWIQIFYIIKFKSNYYEKEDDVSLYKIVWFHKHPPPLLGQLS